MILSVLLLFTYAGGATAGVLYSDATGDVAVPGSPFPHLDIASVDVSNTATDLVFTINLNGDPVATDWGKYMVGIDSTAGGDPVGNGWGRPIGMSSGMDFWLGSWVDGGNGLELRNWNGGSWDLQAASYNADSATRHANEGIQLSYIDGSARLPGLGSRQHYFQFDVYTSGGGGGDGAVDALGNPTPSIADWGDGYNSGSNFQTYVVVPEPGTLTLLALSVALRASDGPRSVRDLFRSGQAKRGLSRALHHREVILDSKVKRSRASAWPACSYTGRSCEPAE